jgi:hypothetical protein
MKWSPLCEGGDDGDDDDDDEKLKLENLGPSIISIVAVVACIIDLGGRAFFDARGACCCCCFCCILSSLDLWGRVGAGDTSRCVLFPWSIGLERVQISVFSELFVIADTAAVVMSMFGCDGGEWLALLLLLVTGMGEKEQTNGGDGKGVEKDSW